MYFINEEKKLFYLANEDEKIISRLKLTKISDEEALNFIQENKSLDEIKKEKLNELNELKSALEFSDITYKNIVFQANEKAQNTLNQCLTVFSSINAVPDNFKWRAKDNSLCDFSLDDLKNLALLIASRTQKITSTYWQLKEQIKNANTKEELEFKIGFSDE